MEQRPESEEHAIAREATQAIIRDLKERRAAGDSWEEIDSEIESAWYHLVLEAAWPAVQRLKESKQT